MLMISPPLEIEVKVTRWDIWLGRRGDSSNCAVARAVRRATGRRMQVHANNMYSGGERWDGPGLADFVRAYDHLGRDAVRPVTLTLRRVA